MTATYNQHIPSISRVKVSHILVETKEMAAYILQLLREGTSKFEELASTLSMCTTTSTNGGLIGWIDLMAPFHSILSNDIRTQLQLRKPGDYLIGSSSNGWHVCYMNDAFIQLNSKKYKQKKLAGAGVLPHSGMEEWMYESNELISQRMNEKPIYENQLEEFFGVFGNMDEEGNRIYKKQIFYAIETMGCQMNKADSERMCGQLDSLGFEYTSNEKTADIIILNTCSIRDHAEQKVYSYVGPHAARKLRGERLMIIVAGCVAQQEAEKLLRRCPAIDVVMGPQHTNRIAAIIEDTMNGHQVVATSPTYILDDISRPRRDSTVTAWVNALYGCNERCSYCVVPFTRGVEQSRSKDLISREIEELASMGYKEITLLGQNIDSWGRDLHPKQKFADLLKYISTKTSIERIRFITSHPRYMTKEVVETVAAYTPLCEHFHIPFQSGDDEILKKMRRGYTKQKYLDIVERIHTLIPNASITADAIVGFPGETEEQFENTLKLMEDVQFDNVFSFAYSPRPNTDAAIYDDQIDEAVKDKRLQTINQLNMKHAHNKNLLSLNKVEEVLVEDVNPKNIMQVVGRTRRNKLVFFDGNLNQLRGCFVNVNITDVQSFHMNGFAVNS